MLVLICLHSASASLRRYPDPLSCQKYYIRFSNTNFPLTTCPNKYVFNPHVESCVKSDNYKGCSNRPEVKFLGLANICNNTDGYYCSSTYGFTYCTSDNVTIVKDKNCPNDEVCQNADEPKNPCA